MKNRRADKSMVGDAVAKVRGTADVDRKSSQKQEENCVGPSE